MAPTSIDRLADELAKSAIEFGDIIGLFGVNPSNPCLVDVNALINACAGLAERNQHEFAGTVATRTGADTEADGEDAVSSAVDPLELRELDKLQWLLVIHYVESFIAQLSASHVDFELIAFQTKLNTLAADRRALHTSIIAHLDKNAGMPTTVFDSTLADAWDSYLTTVLPSFVWTEYPMAVDTAYAAQCVAVLWGLMLHALPIALCDTVENRSPRFDAFYMYSQDVELDSEGLQDVYEGVVKDALARSEALGAPVAAPSLPSLSTKMATIVHCVKNVLDECDGANKDAYTKLGGLFILQGLLTETLSLADRAFRAVFLPPATSALCAAVPAFVSSALAAVGNCDIVSDGCAPDFYDGHIFHALITLALSSSEEDVTALSLADTFGIKAVVEACKAALSAAGVSEAVLSVSINEGAAPGKVAVSQAVSTVKYELDRRTKNKLLPVLEGSMFHQLLADVEATVGPAEEPRVPHDHITSIDRVDKARAWDSPDNLYEHNYYEEVVEDVTDQQDDSGKANSRGAQSFEPFIEACKRYKELERQSRRRPMRSLEIEPVFDLMTKTAPTSGIKRNIAAAKKHEHWAGLKRQAARWIKLFDANRQRQKGATFMRKFGESLLGTIVNQKRIQSNQGDGGKQGSKQMAFASRLMNFENKVPAAVAALKDFTKALSGIEQRYKDARTKDRSFKSVNQIITDLDHIEDSMVLELAYQKDVEDVASGATRLQGSAKAKQERKERAANAVASLKNENYVENLLEQRARRVYLKLRLVCLKFTIIKEDIADGRRALDNDAKDPCVSSFMDRALTEALIKVFDYIALVKKNGSMEASNADSSSSSKKADEKGSKHKKGKKKGDASALFLSNVLEELALLGFADEAKAFHAKMIPDGEWTSTAEQGPETLVEFQMRVMGPFFLRTPGVNDSRVEKFKPDQWQKELLDVVDARRSALISAPTSSGKTFISFYCMETLLKANKDIDDIPGSDLNTHPCKQVVVYVSPTKPLVNQTVAEVTARYEKDMKDGQVLVGSYTNDFQSDAFKCQILVTIPECLEYVLMTAAREKWKSNIKWIIFDEVHSISMKDGGYWERLLTTIDCPFLALSATMGDTEHFQHWLQLQEQNRLLRMTGKSVPLKEALVYINHPYRWNDLDMWVCDDNGIVSVNPLSMIVPAVLAKSGFPSTLRILPEHALELYNALVQLHSGEHKTCAALGTAVTALNPVAFFATDGALTLITQAKYIAYEAKFKELLHAIALESIATIEALVAIVGERTDNVDLDAMSPSDLTDGTKILRFIRHLRTRSNNRVPAIFFHLDVPRIQQLQTALADELEYEQNMHYYKLDQTASIKASGASDVDAEFSRRMREMEIEAEAKAADAVRANPRINLARETKRQLRAQLQPIFERMNEQWLTRSKQHAAATALTVVNDAVAQGTLQRNTPEYATALENATNELLGKMKSDRLNGFCLTPEDMPTQGTPLKPEDIANASKYNERDVPALFEKDPFFKAMQRGIGIHHKTLSRQKRNAVEYLFRNKKLAIVISTETLALGISMPCRTVVLLGDDHRLDPLNYHQMTGRAGRRGHDNRGHIVFFGISRGKIRRLLCSPLRRMTPNTPLDTSLILRACNRYTFANEAAKERVLNSVQSLLLTPYASVLGDDIETRKKNLGVLVRAQLETLSELGLVAYKEDVSSVAADASNGAKGTNATANAGVTPSDIAREEDDVDDGAHLEDWEKDLEKADASAKKVAEGADDAEDDFDDDMDWEDLVDDDNAVSKEPSAVGTSASETSTGDSNDSADVADHKRALGPFSTSASVFAGQYATYDSANILLAYLLRDASITRVLDGLESEVDRQLFLVMLISYFASPGRVHCTTLARGDKGMALPPLPAELTQSLRQFKSRVMTAFVKAVDAASTSTPTGLPVSQLTPNGDGKATLPQALQGLRTSDAHRAPTAAINGCGVTYNTKSQVIYEFEQTPFLSHASLPIPAFLDDSTNHMSAIALLMWNTSATQEQLAEQSGYNKIHIYEAVASVVRFCGAFAESIRRRVRQYEALLEGGNHANAAGLTDAVETMSVLLEQVTHVRDKYQETLEGVTDY